MLDTKEEQKYERLRKLAQELHIPMPEAFLTLEVFDKNGKLLQRHHQRSHSWVRNAYNLMFVQLAGKGLTGDGFGAGKISIKETDASVKDSSGATATHSGTASPDAVGGGYLEHAGHVVHGILVGSGVNAENFEDYVLQTPIAEGAGAGQLNHAQSEANVLTWTPATMVLKNELVRYFNNNSGGNVDVNEVCIAARGTYASSFMEFITSRDKTPSTVTVPDTGQLKVTYSVQLTYPA